MGDRGTARALGTGTPDLSRWAAHLATHSGRGAIGIVIGGNLNINKTTISERENEQTDGIIHNIHTGRDRGGYISDGSEMYPIN